MRELKFVLVQQVMAVALVLGSAGPACKPATQASEAPGVASPAAVAEKSAELPPSDTAPPSVRSMEQQQKPVVSDRVKATLTPGFVAVPAGQFAMGLSAEQAGPGYNDAAQHQVIISRPFELMAAEVTVKQYGDLMATSGDQQSPCKDCPAAMVSWYQAATYCNDLSKRQGLAQCYRIDGFAVAWPEGPACTGYRLPTEAEWEYAARAGATDAAPKNIGEHAWFDENSELKPHSVKGKTANALGLFDMLGNAGEWVWDWQGEYPRETVADPTGPKGGDNRVFRGGNFRYGSGEASYAFRSAYGPPVRVEFIGFRCARTLPK